MMDEKDILAVKEAFGFYELPLDEKRKFLETMFGINISETEISSLLGRNRAVAKTDLAILVRIRMETMEPCPDCSGAGCSSCRFTGRRNIYL